jgi:hypothetical protein
MLLVGLAKRLIMNAGDTAFLLIAAALIFAMTVGLADFYGESGHIHPRQRHDRQLRTQHRVRRGEGLWPDFRR